MAVSIAHVVGARPNFPKAAPVFRALAELVPGQRLVHTGQHYDPQLSDVFLHELGLPEPDVNLGVGSGSHARQTAAIMIGLEDVFAASRPGLVVVYGDVNSTMAATLVAAKLGIPVAHVEAGLRSFDRSMPEEINRVVTDQLCDLLFATSQDAVAHLSREGVPAARIHLVGNPMIDTLLANLDRCEVERVRATLSLPDTYVVATLHRPDNVDDQDAAMGLVKAIHAVADQATTVVPLHPRGRERLVAAGLLTHTDVRVVEPLGYVEFLSLMRGAAAVITDSGGVQEETTVLGVACLTLRSNTERPVTISQGTNRLVPVATLAEAVAEALAAGRPARWPIPPLWDGDAGLRIAHIVARFIGCGP
jgi:UDP-N-acetylglucosamine 2-epimerase (non-hydrolysing)